MGYGTGSSWERHETAAVGRAIEHSQESLRALAKRYGSTPNHRQMEGADLRFRPADGTEGAQIDGPVSEEEAVVVAFRRHTLLPLDDCLYALQLPHLTRSSLHRCLQRHGISRLPQIEGEASAKRKFKAYPIGYFHVDIAEVRTAQGKLYLIVAIDRTSKLAFVELHEKVARRTAGDFLRRLIAAVPYKVHTILTDNGTHFTTPGNYEFSGAGHQGRPRRWGACLGARLRICLRPERHRSSTDKAQAPVDQRASRKNEPHHQGRDRQTLLL
jgi:hypothetical protein